MPALALPGPVGRGQPLDPADQPLPQRHHRSAVFDSADQHDVLHPASLRGVGDAAVERRQRLREHRLPLPQPPAGLQRMRPAILYRRLLLSIQQPLQAVGVDELLRPGRGQRSLVHVG